MAETRIEAAWRAMTPGSAALAAEAARVLPSGITHDSRHLPPYGPYIEYAHGPRKWDVDGNAYVDFFGGHGALLLGHNHPEVLKATSAALEQGTHFGANHPREVRWAEQVAKMVPGAERVRFFSSGAEATMMAVRLARAFTGRPRILRFAAHYHGWQDDMATGYSGMEPLGVPEAVRGATVLVEGGNLTALREAISAEGATIACALLEPLGAATGSHPVDFDFLEALREKTAKAGILLVFDEVITGFRVAPGGVAEASGVTPDLTAMAKIVAGGLPGGALSGRADVMDGLDFAASTRSGRQKIYHPGTFNANPVSAAAGTRALELIAAGDACARASVAGEHLREGLNEELAAAGVPWAAYGRYSALHLFLNAEGREVDPLAFDPAAIPRGELTKKPQPLARLFRLAMLVNGVDLSGWPGGLTGIGHGEGEIAETRAAFRESLAMLKADGLL